MDPVYLIFGGFLVLNLVVGLYYGRNVKTLREYAIGDKNFSTFTIVSTIVSTWTTGSLLYFALSKTYTEGFYFLITLISHVIYIILVQSVFLIRMGEFMNHLSVAESMGTLYGKEVRAITAVGGIIKSFGMITGQFKVTTLLLEALFGANEKNAFFALLGIVVLYSFWGGIKPVTFTDIVQFFSFGVAIPIVVLLMWYRLDAPVNAIKTVLIDQAASSLKILSSNPKKAWAFYTLIIYFLIPTMSPTFFQRIVINRNLHQAKKSLKISFFICLAIILLFSWLGILLFVSDPSLMAAKKNIFSHLLHNKNQTISPLLTGFLGVGILSTIISSIDSHTNQISVLFANDLARTFKIPQKHRLTVARLATLGVGCLAVMVSLKIKGPLDIILSAAMFYMPVVTVPFTLAIFGFRTTKKSILIAMAAGISCAIYWKMFYYQATGVKSAIPGVIASLVFLFASHYALKQPGGWIGIKDKAPLLAERQMQRQHRYRFQTAINNFSLSEYLSSNLPKKERTYLTLGAYIIAFVFGSCFFLPAINTQKPFLSFVLITTLALNSLSMLYPIWPKAIKNKNIFAPFWCLSVSYVLFYASSLLALLSGFHLVHVMLFSTNLIVAVLLLRWELVAFLLSLGSVFGFISYRMLNLPLFLTREPLTPGSLIFTCIMVASALYAILQNQKSKSRLEKTQVTLRELQTSAEETLDQMKAAPDYFARQITQTNHAGIPSAYALSQKLQEQLQDAKVSKEIHRAATELTQKIEKSASYLEKTIYAIEVQTQLQKKRVRLSEFLDTLYERLPDIEEGALLLSNQSKVKAIQCDVHKIHGLLQKTYAQIRLQNPEQAYFYLHVHDTTLRYPNHTKPIPALAFLITKSEQSGSPAIASNYTHLDKISIDPHLVGNPYFQEAQIQVDKHYGYLGLTNVPNEYLIVLPARIDDIRPDLIEDEAAPGKSLDKELMREAKAIELDFWNAIVKKPHYNVVEIEHVVNFMKATHQHQTRKSGHPYYTHTLSVAKYASEHSKEPDIVIAALLHDIVEDTGMTLEEIDVRFGPKVEKLVRLLSNIKGTFKKYRIDSKKAHVGLLAEEREAILIKACDRLHNLQTLGAMPRPKQKAKAAETLEYYTPVIRAAGFEKLAEQLETLAKKFL